MRMPDRIETREPGDYEDAYRSLRFTKAERETLRQLCASRKVADRRKCLAWLDVGMAVDANAKFTIELLTRLASDQRPRETLQMERERWRSHNEWLAEGNLPQTPWSPPSWRPTIGSWALGMLDRLTEKWPVESWTATDRLAHSRSAEVRDMVPAFVLEYFLGAHYGRYFPIIRARIERGDTIWLELLNGCYRVGKMECCEAEIDELLLSHGIEPQFSRSYRLATDYANAFAHMREIGARHASLLQGFEWCYLAGQAIEHRQEIEELLREHGIEPQFTEPPCHLRPPGHAPE